jgi:(p)ppGpp synthase/HD superfamily hydrolase
VLVDAVAAAAGWHAGHVRKGTAVPYLSHLLQVAGLVLEHGGDDEQAAAAALHDAVEDTDATIGDIEARFGPRVARIVADCTDTLPGDRPDAKSPWLERKLRHLDHLATVGADSALVAACDKRHNLESLVADVSTTGIEATAARFSSAPDQWVWYYEQALDRLGSRIPARLAAELADLVVELRGLVGP